MWAVRTWDFTRKLFERLALRLGDEEGGEDTAQHEQREDLQDVVEPWRAVFLGGAAGTERTDETLGDDCTDLAGGGGDTMTSGPVSCGEALAGNDESGGVGAEVEEELGEHEAGEEAGGADRVVAEAHDAEEDGQKGEAHQLDWLAADGVAEGDCDPVTGNGTGADKDDVADGDVVVIVIDVDGIRTEANRSQDSRVVETNTVESNVQEEPRASRAEQDLAILPLRVVAPEVGPRSLGDLDLWCGVTHGSSTSDLIGLAFSSAGEVGLDVGAGLDNITGDIESVAGSLWDGEAVVESDAAWDCAKADNHSPHLVHGFLADARAVGSVGGGGKRAFEASGDDKGDNTSSKLSHSLHGKDGAHHGASPLGCRELRRDDTGKWIIWKVRQFEFIIRPIHAESTYHLQYQYP